jgi:hypothetical protein
VEIPTYQQVHGLKLLCLPTQTQEFFFFFFKKKAKEGQYTACGLNGWKADSLQ